MKTMPLKEYFPRGTEVIRLPFELADDPEVVTVCGPEDFAGYKYNYIEDTVLVQLSSRSERVWVHHMFLLASGDQV